MSKLFMEILQIAAVILLHQATLAQGGMCPKELPDYVGGDCCPSGQINPDCTPCIAQPCFSYTAPKAIDKCANATLNDCHSNAICTNNTSAAGYNCTCNTGFSGNGTSCTAPPSQLAIPPTNVLECTETGMTFTHENGSQWEYVNLLKMTAWTSDPVQRFRQSNGSTISLCGTGTQLNGTAYQLEANYTDCAGEAITLVQSGNVIKREAVVEIQLNANALDPIIRHMNFTKYKLTCEYTRQINMSSSFNVTVSATITAVDKTELATFDIDMDLYDTSSFSVKSSTPKQTTLNEPLYVELKKTFNDTSLKMVVEDCWATDTSDESGTFKYSFLDEGCGLDSTFELLREDASYYRFKINAFVFIQLKSQTYLHCSLYVCDASSSAAKCVQGCQGKRKKRSLEEASGRVRRAIDTGPLELGKAVSSMIQYTPKPTCATTNCPTNSVCIESYPAFCRCNGLRVMDLHTKQCTDEKLVEMKVPTQLTWIDQYKSQSSQFLHVAKMYEDKMIDFYVKQMKLSGIRGIKIVSAKEDTGAVEFRVMMTLAIDSTMAGVGQQIQDLLLYKPQEAAEKTMVNPSTTVEIVPVYFPVHTVTKEESTKEATNTRDMILVGAGVLVLSLIVFAIYIRSTKKRVQVVLVKPEMELKDVKVEPKDNKAYNMEF